MIKYPLPSFLEREGPAMSIHDGHRARKKEQFREHGLDTFADHEVLELLLFFAIPQKDTNPIAHRLLDRFGSLSAVLSAPVEELALVDGVGMHAATLLSLPLPIVRRAWLMSNGNDVALGSVARMGDYCRSLLFGEREETAYELCLDAKNKLLRCYRLSNGTVDAVSFNVRVVVENALHSHASSVVLCHNHPSGVALPSSDDNTATLLAWDALRTVGIELIDHIIVADGDFVSLRENGLLMT